MTAEIYDLQPKLDQIAERLTTSLDGRGGPPNNGGMEERVARLEAGIAHLQEDVREIKGDLRSMFKLMLTGFVITWSGIISLGIGVAYMMAKGFHWL